ncbi:MAG: hypothetical protein JST83_15225 [Bacteroidetes bacterium]|nr:hypothetical protein [Bacteroidota bacterium]
MKNYLHSCIFLLLCLSTTLTVNAQTDTGTATVPEYVILKVIDGDDRLTLSYSDGRVTDMASHVPTESAGALRRMKAFQYLNRKGYELVTVEHYPQYRNILLTTVVDQVSEFYFVKKK